MNNKAEPFNSIQLAPVTFIPGLPLLHFIKQTVYPGDFENKGYIICLKNIEEQLKPKQMRCNNTITSYFHPQQHVMHLIHVKTMESVSLY